MRGIDDLRVGFFETGAALATGGLGAAVFSWLGFPAPFLTGPAVAVTLATLAGWRLLIPVPLRNACFLTLGLSIASTVTPDVLSSVSVWLQSFVVLTLTLVVSIVLGSLLLSRCFGFDRLAALLSAAPGHLSYILSLSAELRSDLPRIAVVQAMRVFFLTLLVPVLLTLWGVDEARPLPAVATMAPGSMVALFVLSAGAGLSLRRLRVPAAWLLGGMFVSAFGHATELSPGLLPDWLVLSAFTVMGTLIGTRFRGQSLANLRRNLVAGLGMTLVACAIAAIGALVVAKVLSLPPALLLIAFAPGGVEVMAAMALQVGVEPTFVAAHHVFRLLILTVLIPVFVIWARRES